ncbi:hypothetical protein ACQEVF_58120 [Nonomuraea polychroma]|uniref:hypothetical protein n=1 Tax=Nonomuraea polychroma TaxID=46176 RepID=UPI003D944726
MVGTLRCRRRDGRQRLLPHARWLALLVAERLVAFAFGADSAAHRGVGDVFALEHAAAMPRDGDRELAAMVDQSALARAVLLQQLVHEWVRKLSGRTLRLGDLDEAFEQAVDVLKEAEATCRLLNDETVPRPAGHENTVPSPRQVRLWQDRGINDRLREAARARDRCAERVQQQALAPARWRISRYLRNGVFEAHKDAEDDASGPGYRCWAPAPEAVSDVLRHWSVPAGRPLEVVWECDPHEPTWLLPVGGYAPGHRGNDGDNREYAAVDAVEAWEHDRAANRAQFAALMKRMRRYWPGSASVEAHLAEAAETLNAEHPQPPLLPQVLDCQRTRRGFISLGRSVTTAWIESAKVACTGSCPWGGLDYRVDTYTMMANAMLTGSLDDALDVWNLTGETIVVARVPGPAGPLYELGSNGSHRLQSARMLNLPVIWAEVQQRTLAPWVEPHDVGAETSDDAAVVVACWRGLLARELIVGRLEDDVEYPPASKLCLDYVAAPWLLAIPETATAWARAYEWTYPGALAELGVPAVAYASADAWVAWAASG